jgi:lysyl-tRNA synthetase class II
MTIKRRLAYFGLAIVLGLAVLVLFGPMLLDTRTVYLCPRLNPDGGEYDIAGEWPSKTVHGAVSEALGEEVTPGTSEEHLRKLCLQAGIPTEPDWDAESNGK